MTLNRGDGTRKVEEPVSRSHARSGVSALIFELTEPIEVWYDQPNRCGLLGCDDFGVGAQET